MSVANPKLSRRSMLAGLGGAAAASLPAIAVAASVTTDPVFAAIETQRQARATYGSVAAATLAIHDRLPEEARGPTRVQIGWLRRRRAGPVELRYAFSHDEIDAEVAARSDRRASVGERTELTEWARAKHAELSAAEQRCAALQAAAGLPDAVEAEELAENDEFETHQALLRATPATIAGALALARYMIEYDRTYIDRLNDTDPGFRVAVLLERAIAALAGTPSLTTQEAAHAPS